MRVVTILVLASFLIFGTVSQADITGDPERITGSVLVFERDASGAVLRGSRNKLLRSVRSGGKIILGLRLDGEGETFECDRVRIFVVSGEEHVSCEKTVVALPTGSLDSLTLRATPFISYHWFDTLGRIATARASIYGGDSGQTVTNSSLTFTWFARVR